MSSPKPTHLSPFGIGWTFDASGTPHIHLQGRGGLCVDTTGLHAYTVEMTLPNDFNDGQFIEVDVLAESEAQAEAMAREIALERLMTLDVRLR